jgi:P27 family predicted phage terminase small subunit
MSNIVNFDKMQVGAKGGGKHWTRKEIESRKKSAEKTKRKSSIQLEMPEWLNDSAKKIWNKTLSDMQEFEVLDNVDADSLAIYCDAVAKYTECTIEISKSGYTSENKHGAETVSPYVRAAQSYSRIVMQYADKLGLNANSRARLAKKQADKEVDKDIAMFGD